MSKIAVIDYGVGNLHSIKKAINCFTKDWIITEDKSILLAAGAIILPGVGSFESGVNGLRIRNLTDGVREFAKSGRPVLGICLGAQLLLSRGYEFGEFSGLDIISGKVIKFPDLGKEVKIPHMGWNKIYSPRNINWDNTILNSIQKNSCAYFVHSYILDPDDKNNVFSLSNYEGYEFCSAVRSGNVYGCQFHPEKSGQIGLKIIKNFIDLI